MSNLFLVTGSSGTGKTSITDIIKDRGIWSEIISHTTRSPRELEVEGEDYYFISKPDFELMKDRGDFAEDVEYSGYRYGISKEEISLKLLGEKDLYAIVDFSGFLQMKENFPDAIGIFIYTDKETCLFNMVERGDSMPSILERIFKYDDEYENRISYDYVVKNVQDKINFTSNIIEEIILQNR